jgi:CheY-like chemotaxis protein
MTHTPIRILLVEDSPTDVELTREALAEARIANELTVARDGVEALEILRDSGSARPDLVLLDLNLPRLSGIEVLREVKDDPQLRTIPIVVLTTSRADEDVLEAYRNHVNAYVRKPVDFDEFMEKIRTIERFWFSIVTLPSEAERGT